MRLIRNATVCKVVLTLVIISAVSELFAQNPNYDILGITYGFDKSTAKGYPRNPDTGEPLLLTTVKDLRKKDDLCYKASYYNINLNTYGSLIGTLLMKTGKIRLIIGDYSELGLGMGFSRVMSVDNDLNKEFGNTVGISANLGTGLIAGYKIRDDIFAAVKYQWIIEQYFAPFEDTDGNALHRNRITGSLTYKRFNFSVNVARPWELKEDKANHIVYRNNGYGFDFKYRIGENKILGFKLNNIKIRYKDLDNDPIPYWETNYSGFQVFAGISL